jgi:hypothetical protein
MVVSAPSHAGDPSPSADKPPSFFSVVSRHGEEHLTGQCVTKGSDTLTCTIEDLQFIPPDLKKIEGEQEELQKELAAAKPDELRREGDKFFGMPKPPLAKRLYDQRMSGGGPKTREYMRLQDKAIAAKDMSQIFSIEADHEKRTCKILTQTFPLEFKKVGPGKWFANPGPSGPCNIATAYELERYPDIRPWWTLTETIVSVGNTTGLCEGLGTEAKQVTVWSPEMNEFELPCDFISWLP